MQSQSPDAVSCAHCGAQLRPGEYRPAYAPLRASIGPLLCLPCNAAAWARIDAAAALRPPNPAFSNGWD